MALKNLMGGVATDDAMVMLRRLCDLLESNSIVDVAGRQRVIVDTAPTTTVTGTIAVSTVGGFDHRQFADQARAAYNSGIRANLKFD
jgi:hypothetical protein